MKYYIIYIDHYYRKPQDLDNAPVVKYLQLIEHIRNEYPSVLRIHMDSQLHSFQSDVHDK